MNRTISPCRDDVLHVLLCEDEHSADYRRAAEHLESCANCQSRLPELAADQREWEKTRQCLSSDDTDRQIDMEWSDRSWIAATAQQPLRSWTDAMSKQLLSPPSHPEMLGRLGRFEIERLIGTGGMGVVFKAFDSELNRPVAIKVLAPHLAGNGAARRRFAREARAAAAIVHAHVVAIHNVESESEPPFLVMQYVPGESLQGRLDREGPLDVCEVLRIAHQTAAALAAAHKQGLVHRDVKPSNILLEQGVDRALLTDFGLARASDDASLTHSGHVPGTPHYMSPEQARGESVDQRSDLFSLGSVLYAMCTGRLPFRADTSYGVLRRITDSEPSAVHEVNPEIPMWLNCVIEKLHAKSVSARYESATEIADLLGECLAHVQQPDVQPLPESVAILLARRAGKTSFLQVSAAFLKRHPITSLVGCAVILIAAFVFYPRPVTDRDTIGPATAGADGKTTGAVPPTLQIDDADVGNWNTTADEIQRLTEQRDSLTSRIDLLWDDMPTSLQDDEEPTQPAADMPLYQETVQ